MTVKAKDIVGRGTLEAWLFTRPVKDARVIASRAALRTVPFVFQSNVETTKNNNAGAQELILACFRANFISWAARKYPAHDMMMFASAATRATYYAVKAAANAPHSAKAAANAAHGATNAAAYSAVDAGSAAFVPAEVVIAATGAAHAAAEAVAYAAATRLWQEFSNDAKFLEKGGDISTRALWGNDESEISSVRFGYLQTVRSMAGFSKDGSDGKWGLWLDWYEHIIPDQRKSLFGEKADVELATQEDEFWHGDPDEVMERVAALVGWPQAEDVGGDIEQRPAPHLFELRDGQIHAYPLSATPINSDAAEDMRSEIVDKANELHERLQRTQAPQRVSNTVDRLLASLGNNITDVKPGIFLSRSRSLEADILQFQTEQARDEMAPDALSMMVDLGACVDDLKGMLPAIADIEAHRIALKLADGAAIDALNFASEIAKIAEKSETVAASSIEALKNNNPDIQEASEVIESSADATVVAEAIKIRAKLIANKLQDVRNFSASVLKNSGSAVGRGVIKGLEIGTEKVVSAAIITGVATLVGGIAGPLAGLGVIVASFSPLGKRAKEVSDKDDDDLTDDQTDV